MSDDFVAEGSQQKKVLPPLNEGQVEYAHELLEELHPLEHTDVREVFPWLGAVTCYTPKQEAAVNDEFVADTEAGAADGKPKTVMVNGKEVVKKQPKKKKNPLGEKAQGENPIAKLGFGIVAYVDMLWCLIWTFTLYTIILLPTFMFFGEGGAYDSVPAAVKSSYLDTYLGNLGYSSVQCAQIPAAVQKLSLSCPYGNIGTILEYGVNVLDADKYVCMNNADNLACKPNAAWVSAGLDSAIGKPSELLEFEGKSLFADDTTKAACTDVDSTLFVQYTCVQPLEDQIAKYDAMAISVASACIIALLFSVSIRYMYQGGRIQQIEWDCATVTAGDFSCEFPIEKDAYENWKRNVYEAAGGPKENRVAPAHALKETLIAEIEEKLTEWVENNKWARVKLYGEEKAETFVYPGTKVADIVFSFNNSKLIEALRERGACIAAQDFDKMRECEAKINDLFQEFDSLTTPTAAFITFESDDSQSFTDLVAEDPNAGDNMTLLGQKFTFKECSEPTDIIWENRHFTDRDYMFRQLWAFIIIGVMIFASFIVIYVISAWSQDLASVFPATDCDGIKGAYGDQLQTYAVSDYDFVQENAGLPSSGCLQCFCQQEFKDNPDTYLTNSYGQAAGEAPCSYYAAQVSSVYLWTSALSYLLIGINYILRTVCIMIVDWIGYSTETERLSKTTNVTFIVVFFNSAFLLLMTNANLSEQFFSFGLTSGSLPDFNTAWFRSVGDVIVAAMVFNVYYPIIEVGMYWALRVLFRCMDRGCTVKGPTRSTSIQGYLSTYQGPVYFMHFKYSSILSITYITMMYGFGMPILFPIAMMSFLILYLTEKMMLFYGYVIPPMYDERLSNDVLTKLQFAPLLYIIFGYWMASNQQLLSNDHLSPVESSLSTYLTNHSIAGVFSGAGWEGIKWPMLVTFILLNIIWYFGENIVNCLTQYMPNLAIGDIEVDESIDNYWASLDDEDRKWSQKEESNARDALKTKILTDAQLDRLMTEKKTSGHTLQGTHSYDILANPLYLDDFQYVPCAEDDRAEMIIDDDDDEGNDAAQSDLVRVALNLAFMTEDKAKSFKFNKNDLTNMVNESKSLNIQ